MASYLNLRESNRPQELCVHSVLKWHFINRLFIAWHDNETSEPRQLGDDKSRATCFLALGGNDDSSERLLYFYLPLKVHASSRRAKHIYLVIPPESFDPVSCINVSASSDAQTAPHSEEQGINARTGYSRARFTLKEPGYVLMPEVKAQSPMVTRSRGLLLGLKSLSQALSFDVYVPHTRENEEVTRHFFRLIRDGIARAPDIDYKATFSGQSWMKNSWTAYGLDDKDVLLSARNPPSYKEAITSSRQDIKDVLTAVQDSEKVGRPEHPDFASHVLPPCDLPDTEGPSESETEGPRSPQDITQADYDREDGPQENGRERGITQDNCQKRKAEEALSDTEATNNKSGMRKRKDKEKAVQMLEDLESAPLRWLEKEDWRLSAQSVFMSGPNRRRFNDVQYRWLVDAALWLLTVWRKQDNALDVYFGELSMLCHAIRIQDRDMFTDIRRRCMVHFVQQERSSRSKGPLSLPLQDICRWIIDFVSQRLGAGFDCIIVDELMALHEAVSKLEEIDGAGGPTCSEVEGRRASLLRFIGLQMAGCVLVALYKGGLSTFQG